MFRFSLAGVALAADPTFEEWATEYGVNSAADIKANYDANLKEIARLRELHPQAEFGVNQFSGMSWEEFSKQMLTLKENPVDNSDIPLFEGPVDLSELATDVDWEVTPVKDQGACGAATAFSAIAAIEHGHMLKSGGTQVILSEGQVWCGKSGGGMESPQKIFSDLSGKPIFTEGSYPYLCPSSPCKNGTDSGVRISGYKALAKSESALLAGLNEQAVSVIIYADSSFQSYRSGVLNATTTCNLNHAVTATGYSSEFIKLKNSWGTSWGESGYIRVKRTTSGCGPFGIYYSTNSFPKGTTEAVEV